jgi:hypothetical protein
MDLTALNTAQTCAICPRPTRIGKELLQILQTYSPVYARTLSTYCLKCTTPADYQAFLLTTYQFTKDLIRKFKKTPSVAVQSDSVRVAKLLAKLDCIMQFMSYPHQPRIAYTRPTPLPLGNYATEPLPRPTSGAVQSPKDRPARK